MEKAIWFIIGLVVGLLLAGVLTFSGVGEWLWSVVQGITDFLGSMPLFNK